MVALTAAEALQLSKSLIFFSFIAWVIYQVSLAVYNVFFHPLRSYPGPLLWAATPIPKCYHMLKQTMYKDMLDLFNKYGPVVRIAPNELAYADPSAWKDIMGHNPKGEEAGKFKPFYQPVDDMVETLIGADRELHGKLRRLLSHGFSDRSMREQEPLIQGYINLLMQRLREHCQDGKQALDMCSWYNFTLFDVIGDLAFGEAFGCLEASNSVPWIDMMFQMTETGAYLQAAVSFPRIKNFLLSLIPKSMMKAQIEHMEFSMHKVRKRMELGKTRNDLIEGLLSKQDELELSEEAIGANAQLLIIAGSETTATLLAGATYLLLTNPNALARLTDEVRSTFRSESEINFQSVTELKYMLACLDEALRSYPPVALGMPRQVPRGGGTYCGKYVPEGTVVAAWQWSMYHYEDNFSEPFAYRPERFLPGENDKYAGDRKEALQPFSFGPRNCIGRNLAYSEMRVIMARLIYSFDMTLAPQSQDWIKGQKVPSLWHKPPLWVHLKPRV